ncbi:MAG TPA: polyprenyl synthetase family protein [Devosia sp.]|jgi:geranylgeranyl diphosphate synthase type II
MSSTGSLLDRPSYLDLTDPAQVRLAIETRLDEILAGKAGVPPNLHGAIRHASLAPSKRVRPVLLVLIADPDLDLTETVLDIGCAVEMVHTASLILDDLPCMDDAQMRRERPTTHIAFGQATAILGAIALLSRAFGIIAGLELLPAETRARLSAVLSEAVGWDGLVAGQEIDINGRASLVGAEQVENLNWLKTGVLFVAAAEMGAILAGRDDTSISAVRRFARHFGLAFQTADDLLDQTANAAQIGKDTDKDGDKATLVSLFGATQARLTCRDHLARAEAALLESGVNGEPIRTLMDKLFDTRQAKTS